MNGVRSEKENMVKNVVMNGVKTRKVGTLGNCKSDEGMLSQSEERLCRSIIKGLAITKDTQCWRMWRKNKNKTSYVLTTSPARNCRGMQCAKLVNWKVLS